MRYAFIFLLALVVEQILSPLLDHNVNYVARLVILFEIVIPDGKVTTSKETIESIDEKNKIVIFKLFDGDIDQRYKAFKVIFQVIEHNNGSGSAKWTVEYEKVNDDVEAPYGYMEYFDKFTKDIDAHLLNA
ncbi:kirola-like [Arachis duranensis]|uniref:Kirola-like n=1 Tax=Arachis duranensis TaxID=130453 RepID=A0A9C6T8U4_ARADU|nr:kirola-like [Arachis duranensis]